MTMTKRTNQIAAELVRLAKSYERRAGLASPGERISFIADTSECLNIATALRYYAASFRDGEDVDGGNNGR